MTACLGGMATEWHHTVDSKQLDNIDSDCGINYVDKLDKTITLEYGETTVSKEKYCERWISQLVSPFSRVVFLERRDGQAMIGKIDKVALGVGRSAPGREMFVWRKRGNDLTFSLGELEGTTFLDGDEDYEEGTIIHDDWIVRECWRIPQH